MTPLLRQGLEALGEDAIGRLGDPELGPLQAIVLPSPAAPHRRAAASARAVVSRAADEITGAVDRAVQRDLDALQALATTWAWLLDAPSLALAEPEPEAERVAEVAGALGVAAAEQALLAGRAAEVASPSVVAQAAHAARRGRLLHALDRWLAERE